ncbi:carbohydrate-binding module family 18 protein [Xylariaceae sp. FL1651]|nr:carbohydrate-binding module family 18 protein [Xylariaceae sp. FL1651]
MYFQKKVACATAYAIATIVHQAYAFRNVMYIDEWHGNPLPARNITAGITHVIMAFADPLDFMTEPGPDPPLKPVQEIRSYFANGTQIGISLGGWGAFSTSFSSVSTADARATFAVNLACWMNKQGFDFIDADWEYPGGHGQNESANPQQEITDFPLLLQAIRSELKNQSVGSQTLSLSVGGTPASMAAFQSVNQTKPIWDAVDFVTIMAYDFVNRASNVTGHHTDVNGTKEAVRRYTDLGLDSEKINLGFAFYAKYFELKEDCATPPVGCAIVEAQNPDGTDTYASGVLTFESKNLSPQQPPNLLHISPDGTCGILNGAPTGFSCELPNCCSDSGWCGNQTEHCVPNCQAGYGACHGPDVVLSFKAARKNSQYDAEAGGMWYIDNNSSPKLFWTWETTYLMSRKFDEIVNDPAHKLGGVSGWSLGEDSDKWEHVIQMQNMTRRRNSATQCGGGNVTVTQ